MTSLCVPFVNLSNFSRTYSGRERNRERERGRESETPFRGFRIYNANLSSEREKEKKEKKEEREMKSALGTSIKITVQ